MTETEMKKTEELCDTLGRALVEKSLWLAVAESCTGGLLSSMITARPGSSAHYLGGVVAYDNSVKTELLGVSEEMLDAEGAVSKATARAMAAGVMKSLKATITAATTGIAGPTGASEDKPVGTVYIAVAYGDKVTVKRLALEGTRTEIQFKAARRTLELLLKIVEG